MLKESKESNSQACQDRGLFIQDLILATLALGFDVDVERDLASAFADCNRENSPPNAVTKHLKLTENGTKIEGDHLSPLCLLINLFVCLSGAVYFSLSECFRMYWGVSGSF